MSRVSTVSPGTPQEAAEVVESDIRRLRALLAVEHSTEHEEAIHAAIDDALSLRDRILHGTTAV